MLSLVDGVNKQFENSLVARQNFKSVHEVIQNQSQESQELR